MRLFSIRTRIIALIFIILVPIVSFQCINIRQSYKNRVTRELESNVDLAQAISASFLNYIEELWIQEAAISTYITSNQNLSTAEISSYLTYIANFQDTILALTWINSNGIVEGSSVKEMLGLSLKERPYVQKILKGEEKVLSDLVLSVNSGKPILPVARAIRKDGQLQGIMLAIVNIEKLGLRFSNLKLQDGEVFRLFDTNGIIVYRNDDPNVFVNSSCLQTLQVGGR